MQSTPRYDRLDALRGLWMAWMVAFHFAFDLAHAGWLRANFYVDPLWTVQRSFILGGFLFLAGVSQTVGQPTNARFFRRWLQIVGAAALVSLGSAWMFPRSWISFGVLHAMAVMLPAVRWGFGRWPSWLLWACAGLALALPLGVQHPWFDNRWWNPVGLGTHKPITEDYVPLLPWLAPMLLGVLAARSAWFRRSLAGGAPRVLVQWGQWPLTVYLVHQPVLLGFLFLFSMMVAS